MKKNSAFEVAKAAMDAIELYRGHYSSGQPYQDRLNELLGIIRANAQRATIENDDQKFLLGFADALEEANKPGKYKPKSELAIESLAGVSIDTLILGAYHTPSARLR